MKVTFLGTGTSQGVPMIGCHCEVCRSLDYRDKRLRSSILIEIKGMNLVIDTGPDFRQQMLRERVNKLDAVLFTHSHKDHIAGLDDIRAFNYLQDIAIPVYGTKETFSQLKSEFYYIFDKFQYPGIPQIDLHEIDDHAFKIGDIKITPLPVKHLHMGVLGFRIGDFSYITDANFIPDETLDLLKGTRVMVLNTLQKELHVSHFNLSQAIEMAEKIGAENTYFIHMSHRMGLHQSVQKELPYSVILTYDGLSVMV